MMDLNLKDWETPYFRESRKDPPKKKVAHYNKDFLQVGRRIKDNSIYYIDLKEACRMLIVGATRCMPKGTLVKTPKGLQPIESCNEVLSYNFKKKKIESKKCIVHNQNKQKVLKIKTKYGIIKCSYTHKFPVMRDGKLEFVKAQNLKKSDKLLKIEGNYDGN